MENKVAIITQSYKNDFRECKLLCESMDKFAPDMDHYIFVNDEDIEMYQSDINSSYRAELDDANKRINSITDSLGKITLITENI